MSAAPKHPATYSAELVPVLRAELETLPRYLDGLPVLDPFAGVGGIWEVARDLGRDVVGMEIEQEWAAQAPEGMTMWVQDARRWALPLAWSSGLPGLHPYRGMHPYPALHVFAAIVTSPSYGNRMADSHEARDDSRRITYRHQLGRPLTEGNSGAMQWGPEYRALHRDVWAGCVAALAPGGRLVLNIADHIRNGERVHVSDWHRWTLEDLGLRHVRTHRVETPGMRFGANGQKRIGYEEIQVWRKQR